VTPDLSREPWLTEPATRAVMDALETAGGRDCARFVGGCVRNALIGQPVSDIDIATVLTPSQVIQALTAAGLKYGPPGSQAGTVNAKTVDQVSHTVADIILGNDQHLVLPPGRDRAGLDARQAGDGSL